MLIDSHCHLHDRQFFTEDAARLALKEAHDAGVEKIVCIGTDPLDSMAACDFAGQNDGVFWTYGVHPSEWKTWQKQEIKNTHKLVAIGEVGLDYHYGTDDRTEQIQLFNEMLQLAKDLNLPLSFHIREAFDDFFGAIANFPEVRGVVHSFTDSKKNLKKILDTTDFYVGVNGLATYSTLPTPPLERILLETDAPFLAPMPYRGVTNEPKYIKEIAEWLSAKLGQDFDTIANITTKNVTDLYKL